MKDINKTKLIEEKKLLEEELGSIGRFNKETEQWEATPEVLVNPEADENDLADRAEDYQERTGTMMALNARLADVNKSLAAIKDGTYGVCEVCGKEIEEDRLQANVSARTCKACMEKVV